MAGKTRASDERELHILALRQRGLHMRVIEERTGVNRSDCARICKQILTADMDECGFWGETPEAAQTGYFTGHAKHRYERRK
jgi:hypothetical protein